MNLETLQNNINQPVPTNDEWGKIWYYLYSKEEKNVLDFLKRPPGEKELMIGYKKALTIIAIIFLITASFFSLLMGLNIEFRNLYLEFFQISSWYSSFLEGVFALGCLITGFASLLASILLFTMINHVSSSDYLRTCLTANLEEIDNYIQENSEKSRRSFHLKAINLNWDIKRIFYWDIRSLIVISLYLCVFIGGLCFGISYFLNAYFLDPKPIDLFSGIFGLVIYVLIFIIFFRKNLWIIKQPYYYNQIQKRLRMFLEDRIQEINSFLTMSIQTDGEGIKTLQLQNYIYRVYDQIVETPGIPDPRFKWYKYGLTIGSAIWAIIGFILNSAYNLFN
jgi:hypothetical protein